MAKCDVCGTDYDKAFQIAIGGKIHTFDSFECALHVLAPACNHCGCLSSGELIEADGKLLCSHCVPGARRSLLAGVADCA